MDTFFQVSLLNALLMGNYDGVVSVSELLSHGNIGIGTFHGLGGELIICDGIAYNGKVDGTACKVPSETMCPFAVSGFVTDSAFKAPIKNVRDLTDLKNALHKLITDEFSGNFNLFYMLHASARFSKMHVRSVAKQQKPYRPMAEVTASQAEFVFSDIEGDIVAIFAPSFAAGINMPDWHFHFISSDRSKGGHILDLSASDIELHIAQKTKFEIILPQNPEFKDLDFSTDLSADTKAVEGTE